MLKVDIDTIEAFVSNNIINPRMWLQDSSPNPGVNHSWFNLYYYKMKVEIITKNRFQLHLILQILKLKFYGQKNEVNPFVNGTKQI